MAGGAECYRWHILGQVYGSVPLVLCRRRGAHPGHSCGGGASEDAGDFPGDSGTVVIGVTLPSCSHVAPRESSHWRLYLCVFSEFPLISHTSYFECKNQTCFSSCSLRPSLSFYRSPLDQFSVRIATSAVFPPPGLVHPPARHALTGSGQARPWVCGRVFG